MSRAIKKIQVTCPHCHHTQEEPALVRSTFCRGCSRHYDATQTETPSNLSPVRSPLKDDAPVRTGFLERARAFFDPHKEKDIRCFECGTQQTVSTAASSTQCPACGAYIDLTTFKIEGGFSRNVRTRGDIIVTKKGDLSSSRAECHNASIEGRLRGHLVCDGRATVKTTGKVLGAIEARELIIERKSDIVCSRPLLVESAEIRGKVYARLKAAGKVTITKHGWLEGSIEASGIQVDKGGVFSGELVIHPRAQGAAAGEASGPALRQPDLFGDPGPDPLPPLPSEA